MTQPGLFDIEFRLDDLSKIGDPLVFLNETIKWDEFDKILRMARAKDRERRGASNCSGRKPFSLRVMFKVLILQSLYDLSDDQLEFMIKDRLSFMRFLGLKMEDIIPDSKSIWHYREMFTNTNTMDKLFRKFNKMLEQKGFTAKKGTLIDATIVNAPIQRNKRDENEIIKKGEVPEEWKEKSAKIAQKDVDARWGSKHGTPTFGYKAHAAVDNKNKILRHIETTPANVHDSKVYGSLLKSDRNSSKDVWADSGYVGSSDPLPEGYREHVCSKGFRGKPLSEFQKKCNRRKSKVRCRVEHVFGQLKNVMNLFIRTIGLKRAEAKVKMAALCYNMTRLATLTRIKLREKCPLAA